MWSGQDPVEQQSLWGNPPQTQSMWANSGIGGGPSQNSYNRPQPQQWPQSQMPQWQQYQQQAPMHSWQQQQQQHQQMGWQNSPAGYGGYEEKKMSHRGGYNSGYGYNSGMSQSSSQQPPWAGQRVAQYQPAPWESPAPTTNGSGWGSSGGGSGGQYRGDWQAPRENDVSYNGMQQPRYDSWPSTGGEDSDKSMWRDPKPKKKVRDTGTQLWGDPCGQQDKILRWKDADHEEFQRGPSSSTWNQLLSSLLNMSSPMGEGSSTWVDSNESSCWPANVWENPEAFLTDDAEPHPLNFNEEPQAYRSNSFSGPKNNEYNEGPAVELSDSSIFALHATFQRAMVNGYLPANMKNVVLDQRQKMMVNTLLQKMVKKEQAEAELEHIRQIMATGEYPVTVAQEHDRITNEREKTKLEIAMISEELKMSTQPSTPWNTQWQKRAMPDSSDQLSAALGNMGISEPEFPKTDMWPSDGNLDWSAPPISVNTDLDKPLAKTEYETTESSQNEGGPKEFIPGKKWEWNDPAKAAEDPNATPGSMKMTFGSPNWAPGACDPWGKTEKKTSQDNTQEN